MSKQPANHQIAKTANTCDEVVRLYTDNMIHAIYTPSGELQDKEDAEMMFEQLARLFEVEDKIPSDISLNNFTEGVQANYGSSDSSFNGCLNDNLEIEAFANRINGEGTARLLLWLSDGSGGYTEVKELKELKIQTYPTSRTL